MEITLTAQESKQYLVHLAMQEYPNWSQMVVSHMGFNREEARRELQKMGREAVKDDKRLLPR